MLDLPEGNTCQTFNWNGREGENAHEKPEILEITGFHDYSHRHFLPPVRLHKAEIGTDDTTLVIGYTTRKANTCIQEITAR